MKHRRWWSSRGGGYTAALRGGTPNESASRLTAGAPVLTCEGQRCRRWTLPRARWIRAPFCAEPDPLTERDDAMRPPSARAAASRPMPPPGVIYVTADARTPSVHWRLGTENDSHLRVAQRPAGARD